MKNNFVKIIIGVVLIIIILFEPLVNFGHTLKVEAQLYAIIFSVITLISLLYEWSLLRKITFYLFSGVLLYANYNMLVTWIADLINPMDGWIGSKGDMHRVLGTNWVWGVVTGLILSPITIIQYNKRIKENWVFEICITLTFLILSSLIYFLH